MAAALAPTGETRRAAELWRDALFIGQSTAITHVHHVLRKLELDSRAAVAAWAVRHGLA